MSEVVMMRVAGLLARRLISSVGLANLTGSQEVTVVGKNDELTPAEVASEFSVSPATVRRWGVRGWLLPTRRLPGSSYRRYSRADIDEFRKRLEAGEFNETVTPAANRRRPAKATPAAPVIEPSVHDASPDVDGAPRLP
jgi:hypothetical protein